MVSSLENHSAVLTMARIAALSGAGSFAQAVTTWDSSGHDATGFCESICESSCGFPLLSAGKCGVRIPLSPPSSEIFFVLLVVPPGVRGDFSWRERAALRGRAGCSHEQ